MSTEEHTDFDDIDTPIDEALLAGGTAEDYDLEALRALAGGDEGEGEGAGTVGGKAAESGAGGEGGDKPNEHGEPEGSHKTEGAPAAPAEHRHDDAGREAPKPRTENLIPADRVGKVLDKIRGLADELGIERPQFGDAVAMPLDEFNDLLTQQNRLKIKAAAAAIDLDAESPRPAGEKPAPKEQKPAFDFAAKEREYIQAQFDGDEERMLQIRMEIRAEERRQAIEEARAEADARAEARISQNMAQTAVERVAQVAVERYPFLNDNGGDNAAMADILEWRDFYAAKGLSSADALQSAVEKIAPAYAPKPSAEAPAPASHPKREDPRPAAALARNAADAVAQPPAPDAGIGNRAVPPVPKIDTQEDWERLPAAERERLLAGA